MLKRTIVGLLLIPVLLGVALFAPKWVAVLFICVFSAGAAFELLRGTKLVTEPRLLAYSMIMAALVPVWSYFGCPIVAASLGTMVFYILVFLELMLSDLKIGFSKAAICMVGGLMVPYMLSSLIRIICMDNGRALVLIPFVAAFMSDIGAYFVGVTLGKHKLCPNISPKKTVEGLAGGIVISMLSMVLYGLILRYGFGYTVDHLYLCIYGLVGSVCGVFGDLSFSVIKRQTGIKDYGKLFPGHGGVLDRFDSVIVASPLIEVLLLLLPAVY